MNTIITLLLIAVFGLAFASPIIFFVFACVLSGKDKGSSTTPPNKDIWGAAGELPSRSPNKNIWG